MGGSEKGGARASRLAATESTEFGMTDAHIYG